MKFLLFSILAILVLSCSEDNITTPDWRDLVDLEKLASIRGYKDFYIKDFRCGVFVPLSYNMDQQYPLIIRLHGYTDTTSWWLDYYKEPVLSKDPAIVLTPKCPASEKEGWGDSWKSDLSPMMEYTFNMYNAVNETFTIDPDRIYIYGSSMGGYGTFAAIQHEPELFAAAYVEAGGGNTNLASAISHIPFWMFHGERDRTVPTRYSRDMYRAVKQLGGQQIRYTEYPGVGHNVWDYTNLEKTIPTWLMAQKKGTIHTAPAKPINSRYSIEQSGVLLSWDASVVFPATDDDIWYVEILKNDTLLVEINSDTSACLDTEIQSGHSYQYQLTGVNYNFIKGKPEIITVVIP